MSKKIIGILLMGIFLGLGACARPLSPLVPGGPVTATFTPTPTGSIPVNLTYPPTIPVTETASWTPTLGWTGTVTVTSTPTPTGSIPATFTYTPTLPVTFTASTTPTYPVTETFTETPTLGWTGTVTMSYTPTPTASIPVTGTTTPTILPTCSTYSTWGDSVTAADVVTLLAGNTSCQKYALAQNSNVSAISFTVDTEGQAWVSMGAGLYADGGSYPGNLIWSSGMMGVTTGLVYFPVPNQALAAGHYWIAVATDSTVALTKASGSTSTRTWRGGVLPDPYLQPGGPFPTPFATPPPSSTSDIAAVSADICY